MNFTKAMDLLSDSKIQVKEMNDAMRRLQEALVAIAEMDNGAVPKFSLMCDGGGAEMVVSDFIDKTMLTKYVRDQLEIVARSNFEKLLSFKPESGTETEEEPEVKIPEALTKEKELREGTEDQLPAPMITGENGKPIVNDILLERLYYKEGKSVKQIVSETGISESAVFNHLKKIREAKVQAAKECARRR